MARHMGTPGNPPELPPGVRRTRCGTWGPHIPGDPPCCPPGVEGTQWEKWGPHSPGDPPVLPSLGLRGHRVAHKDPSPQGPSPAPSAPQTSAAPSCWGTPVWGWGTRSSPPGPPPSHLPPVGVILVDDLQQVPGGEAEPGLLAGDEAVGGRVVVKVALHEDLGGVGGGTSGDRREGRAHGCHVPVLPDLCWLAPRFPQQLPARSHMHARVRPPCRPAQAGVQGTRAHAGGTHGCCHAPQSSQGGTHAEHSAHAQPGAHAQRRGDGTHVCTRVRPRHPRDPSAGEQGGARGQPGWGRAVPGGAVPGDVVTALLCPQG